MPLAGRLRKVALATLLILALLPVSPGRAAGVLAQGNIDVNPDNFVACGTVTFSTAQSVITGEMTAAGFGTTLSTQENALVRDAEPILAFNAKSVQVCTEGLNFIPPPGIVVAQVHWTLEASGESGDVFVAKTCTLTSLGYDCVGA